MKKFLRVILTTSNLILLVFYLLTFVRQDKFPFLNISSVILPYLAIIAFFLSLFYIFDSTKWKWLALASCLFSLMIIFNYYKIQTTKSTPSRAALKLLSYNVSFFSVPTVFKDPYYKPELNQHVFQIRDKIDSLKPDIITLQEFFNDKQSDFYNTIKRYQENGYHYYLKSSPRHHNGTDRGIVTFSKFPIVNAGIICNSTNTYNGAIFTDIKTSETDTIKVINVHLTSMAFYAGKRDLLQLSKFFYHSYSEASKERGNQLEAIEDAIEESPYPVILAGDFNETSSSFIYRAINETLMNSFETNGSGFGFTFHSKIQAIAFRIDHLFYSDDFDCNSFNTLSKWDLSEHKPIEAIFSIK